jgi:tetratricopeptide (TPR) repeat protein
LRRLAVPLLLCGLCVGGCAAGKPATPAQKLEGPPPLASAQTTPSPEIEAAAAAVSREAGSDDYARLLAAIRYVGEHLAYDALESHDQFRRDAGALFRERTLDGCSDFALAELALFRALGYPSRLVLTFNAKWLPRYRQNPLALPNGHTFIEVWVAGRWHLVDPTHFVIYDRYDPAAPYLPGNEIFLARALDFADAGLFSVQIANARLRAAADAFTGTYVNPNLPERWKVDFDYPAAFANLGKVFLGKGRDALGLRLLRKSLALRPDYAPALLALGDYALEHGQFDDAAGSFRKVLAVSPQNAPARAGLAKALAGAAQ